MDAVVGEGGEVLLVDGVPHAEFRGYAVIEPVKDGQSIAPLGRGRESQELGWLHMVEKRAIRRRLGVMELVHDDHVEVLGVEGGEAAGVQALDGGEDVVEAIGAGAADP